MDIRSRALAVHRKLCGKLEIKSKTRVDKKSLSVLYTPGVAYPCLEIKKDKKKAFGLTMKKNTIAIVTDGTAVLGLGNIGPEAALPVMEGKAILFKEFGGVNAIPLCLATTDVEEIVRTVRLIAPGVGGINLEDISAPRCFEIEERLIQCLDIPVFHDDQHGTAVVAYAGLINALKLARKRIEQVRIVINGAGAAGIAVTRLLLLNRARDITLCDTEGMIYEGRPENMNRAKKEISRLTNCRKLKGGLKEALRNADVFIGVSVKNIVTAGMVKSMNPDPVIFALANPDPEILPSLAGSAGARIIATGRSDFPNQINNLLAFPGIFKGVLECGARRITSKMKTNAARAIASLVPERKLSYDYFIPDATDKKVAGIVAHAVKKSV